MNGLVIEVLKGGPFTQWWPIDPAVFKGTAASPRWDFGGTLIPETFNLFGSASEPPEKILHAPELAMSRNVDPLALTSEVTQQVVTATVRFDASLTNENWIGVFIGMPRLAYGTANLVDSRFVSSVKAPSPWETSQVNGVIASWFTGRPADVIGRSFTFQATLESVKSSQLLGSPLFKPEVFVIRERLTNLGKSPAQTWIVLTDLNSNIQARYSTGKPVVWDQVLSDSRFDVAMNPVVSHVVEDPPNFRVVVPATVRVEPRRSTCAPTASSRRSSSWRRRIASRTSTSVRSCVRAPARSMPRSRVSGSSRSSESPTSRN